MNRAVAVLLLCFGGAVFSSARAAIFTVTSLADNGVTGTLRWAIGAANSNSIPPHTVSFNVPPPYEIQVTNFSLPDITNRNVLVNGMTQPGFTGTPVVKVSLMTTNASVTAFTLRGAGSGVQGLNVNGNNFDTTAFAIYGRSNTVSSCIIQSNDTAVYAYTASDLVVGGAVSSNRNYITRNNTGIFLNLVTGGVNRIAGNHVMYNTNKFLAAVRISNCSGVIIGGSVSERNIISGNDYHGLEIDFQAENNTVSYNYFGLDPAGTSTISNGGAGISVAGSTNTVQHNVVAGNGSHGIYITGSDNQILNNTIGLDASGNPAGNGSSFSISDGIRLAGRRNVIYANVISSSPWSGIYLFATNASENQILGNIIGLDPTGQLNRSNRLDGIKIDGGAFSNRIGGLDSVFYRNIISGNGQSGIYITDLRSRANTIAGNFIGTDVTGTAALGNNMGVYIDVAQDFSIGESNAFGYANLISGNNGYGIYILGTNTANISIDDNIIGLDATGTNALGNGIGGISIQGATNVFVGTRAGNVIGGHDYDGIEIKYYDGLWRNISIANNYIGVGTDGSTRVANRNGIYVLTPGVGLIISNNVVSGNLANGISLIGSAVASNYVIKANKIGVNSTGSMRVPNEDHGFELQNGGYAVIGGTNSVDRNIISGNGKYGISLYFCTSGTVSVRGNSIGVNAAGSTILSNRHAGLWSYFSRGVEIGGAHVSARNTISGNSNGVLLVNAAGCLVANNYIGTDTGGMTVPGNLGVGIYVNGEASISNVIERNLIAGSAGSGIKLSSGCTDTFIRGNQIGVGTTPMQPKPNNGSGIRIEYAKRVVIGGSSTSDVNRIAFNTGPGISTVNTYLNNEGPYEIAGNLIYSNAGIAVDLNSDGVTPNDPAPDADFGLANNFQNFPDLNAGIRGGTNTQVFGQLISAPAQIYRVEFFGTDPLSGMIFLGATNVTLPASGTGSFYFASAASLVSGSVVYATATTTNGTSEFSAPLALADEADPDQDLMPSWWESGYGLNASVSNAAGSNADSDGYSDLEEWIAFTDPNDSSSYPRITGIAASTNPAVTFPSGVRVYRLDYSDALDNGTNWVFSGSAVTGTYGFTTLTSTNAAGPRFYRVRAALP